MNLASVASLLLIVASAWGCSADAGELGEPLGRADAGQLTLSSESSPDELAQDPGVGAEPALEAEEQLLARTKGEDLEKCLASCPRELGKVEGCRRNCMCRTGHRPMSDCDLIDLLH
jgi:hypothetical protein